MTNTTKTRKGRGRRSAALDKATSKSTGREIGSLVFYDVDGCKITHADLMKLFDKHGLDKDKYAPAPTIKPENAIKKVKGKINGRREGLGVLVEEINLTDDTVVYGVVDPKVDKVKNALDFKHQLTIEVDRKSGDIKVTNRSKDPHTKIGNTTCKELEKLIRDMYNEFCGHLISRDITRLVMRAFKRMNVVPLRFGGGCYWLAPQHKEDMLKIDAVFNEISNTPRHSMSCYTLTDNNGNVGRITENAQNQTRTKLDKLKKKVDQYREKMNLGKITARSFETKIKEFKELRAEVNIFTDSLKFNASDLEKEITKVEDEVRAMLLDLNNKEEQPEKKTA